MWQSFLHKHDVTKQNKIEIEIHVYTTNNQDLFCTQGLWGVPHIYHEEEDTEKFVNEGIKWGV